MQPLLRWKINNCYILWVRVCSFRYATFSAHAPYCHLWHLCPALQYFSSLSHKRNDFRKKKASEHLIYDFKLSPCSECCMAGKCPEGSIQHKMCVRVSSATLSETVVTLRRNEQGMNKNICWFSRKVPVTRYSCHILTTFVCSREVFEK